MTVLIAGCKTPGGTMKTSSVYDGGAPTKVDTNVGESSDQQCSRFGGEMIDGECICADGTPKSKISGATHCSAWIKKKYPDCYAKGGMPKAYGKTSEALCVCSYGEALKSGSDSCYDQFKAKYADCGKKGGIVLADDSICRCLHGKPALKLSGTCEDDFEKENESCARKLGVTSQGSACRCRDGSIVDADEKATCGDPWFFYSKKSTASTAATGDSASGTSQGDGDSGTSNGTSSGTSSGTGNDNSTSDSGSGSQARSDATCMCQHYKEHCIIFKPGDKSAIKWLKTTPDNCTRNACYKNFSDIIFEKKSAEDGKGGCDGSWDYKAAVAKDGDTSAAPTDTAQTDISKYCICKKLRSSAPVGCGLFLPGKTKPNTYADTMSSCTPESCVSLFGDSYTLKTHCYDKDAKKYLWRHQD
jgi:hypothetical protein